MNFFKIRCPGKDVVQGASKVIEILNYPENKGFIFSEFKENPEILFIASDVTDFSEKQAEEWSFENDKSAPTPKSTEKHTHIAVIRNLKRAISEWEADGITEAKVVAARISVERYEKSAFSLFSLLCEKYPEACVFLFSTSESGTWIGASPEIILTADEGRIESLSLAGTRWSQTNDEPWDEKNIAEQRIVTEFIKAAFIGNGLRPELNGPSTLKAGPVEHLATRIASNGQLWDFSLLRQLCPTPALSGFPRKESIAAIEANESFKRKCYGGLVGLIESDVSYQIYANLRSGRIMTDRNLICLYAGGGITSKSDPETEWEETERKISTIRNLL